MSTTAPAPSVRTVTLPDLGEGLTESDLVEWTVAVGDTVELNQVVAEVETAKALVQLPSPYAGVVSELLVEPGTTVPVGAPLLRITVEQSDDAHPADPPAGAPEAPGARRPDEPDGPLEEPAAAPQRTSVLVGYGPLVEASARPRRRTRSASWVSAHAAVGADESLVRGTAHRGGPTRGRVTNPLVRKLAHDLGVHLDLVEGTGPDGAITREDVFHVVSAAGAHAGAGRAADVEQGLHPARRSPTEFRPARGAGHARALAPVTGSTPPAATGPAGPSAREERVPITGVRKQTAAAMVASAFTAPHASVFLTVDVTPTVELLADLRADKAFADHRITLLTLVAKAVTIALGRHPELNAHWDEDAGEIVRYGYVNLGIAAATPRGLLVPSVKDADRLRLPELADALTALTDAARAGTTTPADLAGGTVTITNIGVFGVDAGTPILVPGQAAILGVGAVRRQPWEHRGEMALRSVLTLSVSFDHRLVDGAEGAQFLADVGAVLARPASVLAMV